MRQKGGRLKTHRVGARSERPIPVTERQIFGRGAHVLRPPQPRASGHDIGFTKWSDDVAVAGMDPLQPPPYGRDARDDVNRFVPPGSSAS